MALDGIFLRHIADEIKKEALGARISQIYQPNKDELVFLLRTFGGSKKLLLSARANSPRINFTSNAPENPAVPPMFCMLLRKRLGSGKLTDVRQVGLERTLFFDFDTVNELGDCVKLTVAVEIMGKYSNVILVDENGLIVDSLKRVDMTMSNFRLVLPNLKYEMPPAQDKLNLLEIPAENITERIISLDPAPLNKAILNTIQGISPIVCREIENTVGEALNKNLSPAQKNRLVTEIQNLAETAAACSGEPYMLLREGGKPFDFCFMNIAQYLNAAEVKKCRSFSELLENFYSERDCAERMHVAAQDLFRLVSTVTERLSRKLNTQRAELAACENRETLRIYGDLLQANLYRIPRGAKSVTVENFYDENYANVEIPLDPAVSPAANSQKFYKEYRKAKTRESVLSEQIKKAAQELVYMQSVAEELSRARSERELAHIRAELAEQGYIRAQKGKQKPPAALEFLKFSTEDGFLIIVGRNNKQNDKLTLKTANKNDIWFHTKDIHGSHTVLVTEGREPSDSAILAAAQLAAYHSKARDSENVAVDYTKVRYVSKPTGAKPGMVIYTNQKTLFVNPKNSV